MVGLLKPPLAVGRYYAHTDFSTPKSTSDHQRLILEILDMGKSGLSGSKRHEEIIRQILPQPVRYQLVWSKETDDDPQASPRKGREYNGVRAKLRV